MVTTVLSALKSKTLAKINISQQHHVITIDSCMDSLTYSQMASGNQCAVTAVVICFLVACSILAYAVKLQKYKHQMHYFFIFTPTSEIVILFVIF